MQIGGGSMIFMQGKGGHINLCTHIRELCYTKGEKGGGSAKKRASQRGGSGEFEHGLPPWSPSPLNNDRSLTTMNICYCLCFSWKIYFICYLE